MKQAFPLYLSPDFEKCLGAAVPFFDLPPTKSDALMLQE
jgi:hypothetical protein